ncbi:hypothetical protein [Streptomyces brasiliensis]|uniref:Uncharacterized protein n=1 Tax=Streptomyces brasiliensis TaxID=1954 RepID=A0A917UMC4_9ACTN|nr:hypothetical protein [Streptomyces brasiliensis]GGJ68017.1 hypothetical protein GCM10010121_093380 [Streptomyces brasiliensis]
MPQELTTQEQFDAFADEVARELGTHCRTAPHTEYARGLARLIIDGDGRALRLCQPDDQQPGRVKIYAALPDESQVQAPSIQVTAISARHVAREITRRLYPLHTEAADLASQLAARQQAEADGRRTVAEAVADALPGARIDEEHRRTRIVWQRASCPLGQQGPVQVDSVCVVVGASGEWVTVEAAGRPDCVIPMLAAFADTPRE